ncbi:hypothetical protein D9M69_719300 [compost metagenome]
MHHIRSRIRIEYYRQIVTIGVYQYHGTIGVLTIPVNHLQAVIPWTGRLLIAKLISTSGNIFC